jgi:type II restriction/modification system DNA methylase subunit YeeA
METAKLKKFAQFARRSLIEQVSAKLKLVLAEENPARRERPQVIKKLENAVAEQGKEQVIERVAYIWFNRFCALRFMDVNRYNRLGIVSPAEGQFQPEILADAKMGQIDEEMVAEATRRRVFALLDGKTPSQDPQGEAYRLLVVAACNYWHGAMPFLFERIDDYTELLMPGDLLSGNSILAYTREAMTPDACEDVEVIGWLYQFYISEKKDKVFEGLKKSTKITAENIPAATQLFTPHWIVRYLVENSLGRLWMLNRPNSRLVEQMDYYIKPAPAADGSEQPETDFLRINKPEEIKICDPACGSGHMLTYAFDLLYAIYEEEGYEPADIPAMILTHNLYGIEIDERAGELAAFALTMKARAKQRRFFRNPVQPNICVLENVHFDEGELNEYMDVVGRDLFTDELRETLLQFEQAKNFGSLIVPKLRDPAETLRMIDARDFAGDLLLNDVQARVVAVLHMAEGLSPKYHVVVANPPYMGGKGMNGTLQGFLKENFADVKSDLFSSFMVRNTQMSLPKAQLGFMTPFVWMFISSYEKLRLFLLRKKTITSLIQLEYSGFDGATVPICTFTLENSHRQDFKGGYVRLSDFRGATNQGPKTLEAIRDPDCGWFYRASAQDFDKIPSSPIAYWISKLQLEMFANLPSLSDVSDVVEGTTTGDVNRFLKLWPEISKSDFCNNAGSKEIAEQGTKKWFPYNKGGEFRKWYGNNQYVVNWRDSGFEIKKYGGSFVRGEKFYFRPGITWSKVSSGDLSFRRFESGFAFDTGGLCLFSQSMDLDFVAGLLNSKAIKGIMALLAPTLNFTVGTISSVPIVESDDRVRHLVSELMARCRNDWDAYETSWDFTTLPLLQPDHRAETLEHTYTTLRAHWQGMTDEVQRLEEENNRIFIDAYGLQNELTPEVPLEEITLTCNPAYRYGGKASVADRETRLRSDTVAEFLSYAVGCMFGRYALDKPGLILANQGETIEDYLKQIPEPSFPADDDNVIPMLDGDWFSDDISERFREFLRITFGEEHYEENLRFVEQALGKDIRKYFLKDFYNDHVRRCKKRPIYWLFSSPKGSFNALIYMHRYRPDTVSVVLNDYLREFRTKLTSRRDHLEAVSISASASSGEKTKAIKDIEKISKIIVELGDYERDVLYPLATKQVEIDLDDGVKVNYPKLGAALKKIPGLIKGEG